MLKNETVLIAPLNWGLGHATRCIPLINKCLKNGNKVIIASDGEAMDLLKKEFPQLPAEELSGYDIRYPKKAFLMPLYMLMQSRNVYKSIKREHKETQQIVEKYAITQIISDNRYGVYHKKIPSFFLSHQLRVLSGIFTPISTYIQKKLLRSFDEVWVPDYPDKKNLSGKLSHELSLDKPIKYIGPMSRLNKNQKPKKTDIFILLSGPEPQRSLLEKKLIQILSPTEYKIILVQGKIAEKKKNTQKGTIKIINYLLGEEIEGYLQSSRLVISRSGYTSIMDYHHLNLKALLVPTPGQYEQEYLAKHLLHTCKIPYLPQNKIDSSLLISIKELLGS